MADAEAMRIGVAEAMRIRAQYTGRVPVLCTRHEHGGDMLQSPKSKYLIPGASSAHELQAALREDTSHGAAAPLHLYLAGDAAIDPETTLAAIDAASGAADGFLHIWYSSLDAAQLGERREQGGTPSKLGGTPSTQGATASVQAPLGEPVAAAASPPSEAALQSPHGDRVPMGLSSAACTFLNPRGGRGGELKAELTPSLGGRVPAALFVAVILDVLAVGLVVPLLAAYSRELGGGPRFTGVLQAGHDLTLALLALTSDPDVHLDPTPSPGSDRNILQASLGPDLTLTLLALTLLALTLLALTLLALTLLWPWARAWP